jgi:hypothetical protein
LKDNVAFTAYDRTTFYTNDEAGYIDYPFRDGAVGNAGAVLA